MGMRGAPAMRRMVLLLGWLAATAMPPVARGQAGRDETEAFFEAKVRPVLARSCFKCHGGQKTSHGLRVDSREALVAGGENGPAIVTGDPDGSLLIRAVRYDHEDVRMPPGGRLPEAEVADLAA